MSNIHSQKSGPFVEATFRCNVSLLSESPVRKWFPGSISLLSPAPRSQLSLSHILPPSLPPSATPDCHYCCPPSLCPGCFHKTCRLQKLRNCFVGLYWFSSKSLSYTWASAQSACPLATFPPVYLHWFHPSDLFAHRVILTWVGAVCHLFLTLLRLLWVLFPCSVFNWSGWQWECVMCVLYRSLLFLVAGRRANTSLSKSRYC